MKEHSLEEFITVGLSLSNLLITALGLTDLLGSIYSMFSCISEIQPAQQRLMLI
jgi:hypothetical protein